MLKNPFKVRVYVLYYFTLSDYKMENSFVSVIITAFNRKEYINDAINSVLNQSLDSSRYELIVVTNYDISVSLKGKINFININKNNNERFNLMIYGIKAAKGDIICFLDDDDIYDKFKLEKIVNIFSKNKRLGYIHNAFCLIDESGQRITSKKYTRLYKQPHKDYYITYKNLKKFLSKITYYNGLVNLSTISIRKTIIDKDSLDYFLSLPGNFDEFVFYEFLRSQSDLFIGKDILSHYRIHRKNNSKSKTPSEIINYTERLCISTNMLYSLLIDTPFSSYAIMKLKYWIYKTHLLDDNFYVTRKFLTALLMDFVKYRTDYYFSMLLLTLYKFIFKRSPVRFLRYF